VPAGPDGSMVVPLAPEPRNPLVWIVPSALAALLVLGGVFYLITTAGQKQPDAPTKGESAAQPQTSSPRPMPPPPAFAGWSYDAAQLLRPHLITATGSGMQRSRSAIPESTIAA